MMALVAQGYDSCPMEGFDQNRVKKILKLNSKSHIVMVLGVGKAILRVSMEKDSELTMI